MLVGGTCFTYQCCTAVYATLGSLLVDGLHCRFHHDTSTIISPTSKVICRKKVENGKFLCHINSINDTGTVLAIIPNKDFTIIPFHYGAHFCTRRPNAISSWRTQHFSKQLVPITFQFSSYLNSCQSLLLDCGKIKSDDCIVESAAVKLATSALYFRGD